MSPGKVQLAPRCHAGDKLEASRMRTGLQPCKNGRLHEQYSNFLTHILVRISVRKLMICHSLFSLFFLFFFIKDTATDDTSVWLSGRLLWLKERTELGLIYK